MNFHLKKKLFIKVAACTFFICSIVWPPAVADVGLSSKVFNDYWYSGKAEVTRYKLLQVRYGQHHEGDTVLIFVTEHMLPALQVKYEHGPKPKNLTSILKLNKTSKFETGIYPYSTMTSIFSPIGLSAKNRSLKLTQSTQEWCGQQFMQLNLRGDSFAVSSRSYFQDLADSDLKIRATFLEDEIFTQIRLAPSQLPLGEIDIIPGAQYAQLFHKPMQPYRATATYIPAGNHHDAAIKTRCYQVTYKELPRIFTVTFAAHFPYGIIKWEEKQQTAQKDERGNFMWMSSTATRTHEVRTDYWRHHHQKDAPLRLQLGLPLRKGASQ